jgi:hypothetical protein
MIDDVTPQVDQVLEKKRFLGKQRAKRFRDRNAGKSVRNAALQAVPQITVREARVLDGILAGKSKQAALIDAGFKPGANGVLEAIKPALQAALAESKITQQRICDNVSRRLEAKTPMLTAEGCIDRDDWSAQSSAFRDAVTLADRAGLLPAASPQAVGTQITVNVLRYDDHRSTMGDNDRVDAPALEAECNDNG